MKLLKVMILILSMNLMYAQAGAGVDLVSKYVWRGGTVVDGLSVQPSVDLGLSALNLNVWGSFGLSDRDVNKAVDELDYTLTYGLDLKAVEANIGAIYYQFPNFSDWNTLEIFGDASFKLGGLGASAAFYYDVDVIKDFYVNFGVSKSMVFADFSTSLGYSNFVSDISDINFTLERGLDLVKIEASVHASFVISPANDDNVFYAGVHLGF